LFTTPLAISEAFALIITMLNQQSYSSPGLGEDEMLFDDTTLITFGENKKSNCKTNKNDAPVQYPTGIMGIAEYSDDH
jgi:hypothetical protein